ncbi:hypothetical protein OROMI_018221 [Orobanche minor]
MLHSLPLLKYTFLFLVQYIICRPVPTKMSRSVQHPLSSSCLSLKTIVSKNFRNVVTAKSDWR